LLRNGLVKYLNSIDPPGLTDQKSKNGYTLPA